MKPAKTRAQISLVALIALAVAAPSWAAIGDNAPPIPLTYKTSHPRLPFPDSGFLTSLAGNATAMARYNAAADAWNSTDPGNATELRQLLIAYWANKTANPTKAAGYLTKIKALANLGGTWGKLLYSVNDGAGTGTYTVTSASANFLTGCGGRTCRDQYITINTRTYVINNVPNANTVVLSQSNPPVTGTNLKIRILGSLNAANSNIALVYDWMYNDLDAATRQEFMNQLEVLCTLWREDYEGLGASPYNDMFYLHAGAFGLIGALAIYPDHPKGVTHLRYASDVWFNILMPVWRQVFGPEGGGWHESWPDYINPPSGGGLTTFLVPSLLSWQAATGDPIFARETWLKNFAYSTMYATRPDFVLSAFGDMSRPYLTSEYDLVSGAGIGSLNGLAEIYNDPVLRGWARLVNRESPDGPDGFEPSAWPFYTPDKKTNAVASRSALPPVRNFSGLGVVSMRTGWTEDDTAVALKYGANFWSHEHLDAGAFTIFNRGNLAIDSGSYRPGYTSKHVSQYARQTIAHNTLTITDPADVYPTTFTTTDEFGNTAMLPLPNDGGQRRIGSPYNERFPNLVSPDSMGAWMKQWEYYHTGTMVAYASAPKYTYTAVDITSAYNNAFSATSPDASNRTNRVQKAVRHLLFVPRGTAAYVVVFDQVISTKATFVKRWLLHSVNQPAITGNKFVIVRNELVNPLPYVGLWPGMFENELKYDTGSEAAAKYQYNGKLHGWMVLPQGGTINAIGGPGKEFWIEDPLKPGTGTNWNQCQPDQCEANIEGLGSVENFINPDPKTAPHEPGSWRLEVKPGSASTQDFFLHVMLATNSGDTSVPANVTVPAGLAAGTAGATWTEGGKTYTVTFPQNGVGGHITISGTVDEDLLTYAQELPAQIQISSGAGQTGPANGTLASPLKVVVKDSAGAPVPNAAVHFAVTEGEGRVPFDTATTNAQGIASTTLTLGPGTTGSITKVMANVHGLQPVEFQAAVGTGTATPTLSSLSCNPTTLASATTATCTVALTQAAASGGATIALSSNTALVTVPASVAIPAGATTKTFTATAGAVTANATATVTASFSGVSKTESLTLQSISTGPVLSSLSCTPTSLASGSATTCTVTLSQAAGPSGLTVTLSSDSAALAVPATAFLSAGYTTKAFTATAGTIAAGETAVITSTYGGISKTASITLTAPAAPPVISSLLCNPTGVSSGSTATCTVLLSAAAPAGGAIVVLASNSAALTVPATVLVAAGATTKTFTATAGTVTSAQSAEITATLNGTSELVALNLYSLQSGGVSIPTNKWVMVPTKGLPVQTVGYEKLVYAPAPVKKAVLLGNYHQLGAEPNQALIAYDFDENRWSVLDIGESYHSENMADSGHTTGAFTYDPSRKSFIYYCCASGSNQPENVYNMWWYDAVGQTGRSKPTSRKPGFIQLHGATFDPYNDVYVLHGGGSFVGTWTYDPATNAYTQQTPKGTSPDASINFAAMTFNPTDRKVYLFGGQTGTAFSNDLYTYDVATNTWTKLAPSGTRPAPRWNAGFAYDSTNNIFLVYGGENGSTVFNDTWVYKPATNAWAKLAPAQSPAMGAVAPFETLAYDSDHNVFVLVLAGEGGYADGTWSAYATQTWFYRYSGTGPNAGTVQPDYQPTAGSINQNPDAWAKEPSLASSAGTLYTAWVETGRPFDLSEDTWFHVYAGKHSNGSWSSLGATPTALDSEFNSYSESHSPSITVVNGTPWISWYKWNNGGDLWSLWAKKWTGTAWQGGMVGRVGKDPTFAFQGRSQMADVGGIPYVAFLEVDKTFYPQKTFLYVKYWNGTQWVLRGTGPLNAAAAANTTAESVSITSNGISPYVAWTEYTSDEPLQNTTPPQVHVARWDGTKWVAVGGSLNVNASSWANDAAITFLNGQPYVAWTEKTEAGDARLFVKTFNGTNWVLVGSGTLNKDTTTGWAFRPSIAADAATNALYVAWVEQQALGERAQVYVSKYTGSNWSALGTTLNANPVLGSAQRVSLAVVGGQPVAAWGEVNAGSLRQVFAKKWNGSAWVLLSKGGTTPPPPPPPQSACDLNGDGSVSSLDVDLARNQALGVIVCGTADLQQNGKCDVVDVQRVVNATLGRTCVVGP